MTQYILQQFAYNNNDATEIVIKCYHVDAQCKKKDIISRKCKMWKWKHCRLLVLFVISFITLCNGDPSSQKPICERNSPLLLGPLMVLQVNDVPSLTPNTNEFKEWYGPNEDNGYTFVEEGGTCKPHNCISRWPKVAIIVPFRDRGPQLEAFLYHIHPVLQRQQLNYRIFVVEQSPEEQFNRYFYIEIYKSIT